MAININHQTDTIEASGGTLNLPDFSGGGGLTNFTEAESTASPNDTVSVDSLTAAAAATNADVALVAKGTGATLAQVPDGTAAGGNKRGSKATDWQKSRGTAAHVASGSQSVISGGSSNTASGSNSVVCGGENNTASDNYSSVSGGSTNTASGGYTSIGGGRQNTSSGTDSTIAGGRANSATGNFATICGGYNQTANSEYSFLSAGNYGNTRSIVGYHAFPACNAPITGSTGRTQGGLLLLGRQTTDATATVLRSNASAASTTNQVILPNNSAYSFSGEVIAGVTAAGDTARWTIDGAIKRGANAASTAMVGTPTVTMTHNDAGAAAWAVAVTADTTNGGIKVEVTGAAATTIRWVCKINTTEMTY